MDEVTSELQRLINEDAENYYSPVTLDHAMNPRNMGRLPGADGWARYTGPCGDTMEVWIVIAGGEVSDAHFWTDGCGSSIASGSMVTEMARGGSLEAAMEIGRSQLLEALGGLPSENEHCAELATITLKLAISDYLSREREPWRKEYDRR